MRKRDARAEAPLKLSFARGSNTARVAEPARWLSNPSWETQRLLEWVVSRATQIHRSDTGNIASNLSRIARSAVENGWVRGPTPIPS